MLTNSPYTHIIAMYQIVYYEKSPFALNGLSTVCVGNPMKSRARANNKVNRLNNEYGGYKYHLQSYPIEETRM